MAKVALGKGLGSLIQPKAASPEPIEERGERIQQVRVADIVPSRFQPRTEFRADQLEELVESIREKGIIQPLIVRKDGRKFELVAGERRWRAAQEVGLAEAPVIVRDISDLEVLELALIENLQREDLNPIEEARAYRRLTQDFDMTQEKVAQRVGKSRAAVANALRLLDLDDEVQSWLIQQRISVGHAKVLLGVRDAEAQRMIAERIIREGASVRATEKLISSHLAKPGTGAAGGHRKKGAGSTLSPALQHVQNILQHRLGTRVVLHHGTKTGKIEIEYYGNDDLHRILDELGIQSD